jgi:hypothetical protein
LRVLLALAFRFRRVLLHPLPAVGETVGSERLIGLDRVVEIDARLERLVLDGGIGAGLAGEDDRAKQDSSKNDCASHVALFGGKTLK